MYSTVSQMWGYTPEKHYDSQSELYGTLMDRKLWQLFNRNQAHSLSKRDLKTVVVPVVITILFPVIMHLAVQKPPLLSA